MACEMKELRGQSPADLVRALDAIALAKNMDRNEYVNQLLTLHVKTYLAELTVVQNMLRGNALLPDASRSLSA